MYRGWRLHQAVCFGLLTSPRSNNDVTPVSSHLLRDECEDFIVSLTVNGRWKCANQKKNNGFFSLNLVAGVAGYLQDHQAAATYM